MSIDTGRGVADPGLADRKPPRPGRKWKLLLVGLTGVYAALGVYGVVTNAAEIGGRAAAPAAATATAPGKAAAAAPGRAVTASPTLAKPARLRATQPARGAAGPAAQPLGVASVTAFGPGGAADGDNPAIAERILDVSTEQPWYSQWYATPAFGGLRPGTGLLLDLGSAATVTNVTATLGATPGTDVQVRVGNAPFLGLPTVASAFDVGGTVRLTTSPAQGRYVLLWFTRLPADGHGHYQVSVYDVTVDGRAA